MPIKVQITSGGTDDFSAFVDKHGHQNVALRVPEILPAGTPNRFQYFSQLISSNGDGTGTTNMNVDGSSTVQEFSISSTPDYDIFLMGLLVFIGDASVVHSAFGNVAALTTGWDLLVRESGTNTFVIEKAKTGSDVIIQSATTLAWGDGSTSFELTNFSGTEDATLVYVPVGNFVPGGLRIGRGTQDLVVSSVNDDLTGLTRFEVRGLGFKHLP